MPQLPELTHILNQRVCATDKKGQKWYGELQFVGTNELFPSWGLVCTISRVPAIQLNSIMDIVVLDKNFNTTDELIDK